MRAPATQPVGLRFPALAQTPRSEIATVPAPSLGWVVSENFAESNPRGAQTLENWLPTPRGARVRKGCIKHATAGAAVTALLRYKSTTELLFAATATDIYDITNPADPDVAPAAAVTAQTGGDWIAEQIGTSGGDFLVCVNGTDLMQQFDGAAWGAIDGSSTPAITGVATSDLSYAWKFAERLFFVEKDTLNAWYLPVASIGGAASSLSLASVVRKGGSLLMGFSWSVNDAGDGMDDRCVFVTTEGEVVIYAGTDPSDAAAWERVGVYDIGRPMGKRAWMRAGGDIVIATEQGFVPLSQAVVKDPSALSFASPSAPIFPEWRTRAENRTAEWIVAKSEKGQWALIATDDDNLAVNTQTGGWALWRGWAPTALAEFDGGVMFGQGSAVYEAESGGSDDGEPYECRMATAYNHLGSAGFHKHIHMVRATFLARTSFNAKVSVSRNYAIVFPSPPPGANSAVQSLFGVMQFGSATFYAPTDRTVTTQWRSVNRSARVVSAQVQITCADSVAPIIELASVDVLHDIGGSVV